MTRLFILALLFASCTQAQKQATKKSTTKTMTGPSPAGAYKMSKEHDPQGTPTLFVLENNQYVIAYFGGVQVGTWKIVRDSFVVFTPYTAPAPYELFGRHNPALKDSVRMFFTGFSDESCFIALNAADVKVPVLQRVFNASPNCMSFPNVYRFAGGAATLSFAHESYSYGEAPTKSSIYTFTNAEQYNDFIAYHFPSKNSDRPFFALWRKQQLYFNQFADEYFDEANKAQLPYVLEGQAGFSYDLENGNQRGPLPTKGEDADFIRGLGAEIAEPDTVYFNPFYKEFQMNEAVLQQGYTYHPQKIAWLGKEYTEGEENGNSSDLFNSSNVIYLFRRLPAAVAKATDFTINTKPLFTFTCD